MLCGLGNRSKKMGKDVIHPSRQSMGRIFHQQLESEQSSPSDKNAWGFLKRQATSKVEGNEQESLEGKNCEPISYEWMFRI